MLYITDLIMPSHNWLNNVCLQVIQLEFTELHLEDASRCRYDVINIYDDSAASGSKLAYFCGNANDNLPSVQSTGRDMTVEFISDGSVQFTGFSATYTSTQPSTGENHVSCCFLSYISPSHQTSSHYVCLNRLKLCANFTDGLQTSWMG